MGRKKKRFIDKKKAQTFHLVARSQADPLYQEPGEAQHVLKPVESSEGRLREQQSYGIYYDDDYDYLQHLKEPGTAVLEPVGGVAQTGGVVSPPVGAESAMKLPVELFGSEVAVSGQLRKVTPLSGPQPDWDPDIVAALDSVEMTSDPEEQLEDDFVIKANGGELGVPVYITTEMEGGGEAMPWWQARGDFHLPAEHEGDSDSSQSDSAQMSDSQSDASEDEGGAMPEFEDAERKTARFTEYSISSSVVPRNDALTLLDKRFERFMVEYDDTKLGSLEEEVEATPLAPPTSDKWLLEQAISDFHKNLGVSLSEGAEVSLSEGAEERGPTASTASASESESESGDSDEGSSGCGSEVREVAGGRRGEEAWDCESILSTYSNLYNHPTKISEPRAQQQRRPVQLSSKTGIPLGAIPGPSTREREAKRVTPVRAKGETPEERRMRKMAVREERKHRRAEKKGTKMAFKSEQLRQERAAMGQSRTTAVV